MSAFLKRICDLTERAKKERGEMVTVIYMDDTVEHLPSCEAIHLAVSCDAEKVKRFECGNETGILSALLNALLDTD